jgi:putative copper resistance protein D
LLLGVGTVEMARRTRRVEQTVWGMPLPAFAVLGGVMLFLHSHGAHPASHKIAIHHAVMGTMAIVAGSCKLVNGRRSQAGVTSGWELAWAGLILMIGVQLLIYSE